MSTFDTINGVSIEIEPENGMHFVWLRCRHDGVMTGGLACACTTDEEAQRVASALFDVLLRASHVAQSEAVPHHSLTITGTAEELSRALSALR